MRCQLRAPDLVAPAAGATQGRSICQALRCPGVCDAAEADAGAREPLRFVHAAAEATGLPAASADLVAACLVAHELPAAATHALIAEALRLLRPQGSIAIMVRTRELRDALPCGLSWTLERACALSLRVLLTL